MRALLDTHVAIWTVANTSGLPDHIRALLSDTRNEVYISAVSILEIAIKRAGQRVNRPPFSAADAIGHFREVGFMFLDVTAVHAAGVERLQLIHGDPFDRLLVAQALAEPLRLITRDRKVAAYSDTVIVF